MNTVMTQKQVINLEDFLNEDYTPTKMTRADFTNGLMFDLWRFSQKRANFDAFMEWCKKLCPLGYDETFGEENTNKLRMRMRKTKIPTKPEKRVEFYATPFLAAYSAPLSPVTTSPLVLSVPATPTARASSTSSPSSTHSVTPSCTVLDDSPRKKALRRKLKLSSEQSNRSQTKLRYAEEEIEIITQRNVELSVQNEALNSSAEEFGATIEAHEHSIQHLSQKVVTGNKRYAAAQKALHISKKKCVDLQMKKSSPNVSTKSVNTMMSCLSSDVYTSKSNDGTRLPTGLLYPGDVSGYLTSGKQSYIAQIPVYKIDAVSATPHSLQDRAQYGLDLLKHVSSSSEAQNRAPLSTYFPYFPYFP